MSIITDDLKARIEASKNWYEVHRDFTFDGHPVRGYPTSVRLVEFLDSPKRIERYGLGFIGRCVKSGVSFLSNQVEEMIMAIQEKEAQLKALISRIADDIWNRGDLTVVDEVMSASGKYHGPHMPNGTGDRETWRRAIGMYRSAFPDSHVRYDDLIVCGDTIVGRWSATATHTGQLPGVGPTGKQISIGGITIYRTEAGKIVEAWEQLDMLGMWQQIGVVSLPGHD